MSKLKERLLTNTSQVREAERRLAIQHSFIERLQSSARDTRSAEEALEVMRDLLRGLYYERSQLRRKVASRKQPSGGQNNAARSTKRGSRSTCVDSH
jgi:hypothetical protein